MQFGARYVRAWILAAFGAQGLATSGYVLAQNEPQLEEVTVTARRVEENLQAVPESVSVLSGDQIEARSMADLRDIARFTPNVYVTTLGATNPDQSTVYIRGIGGSDYFATSEPGVGVYIDGVYFGRAQGMALDLLNIDRVEVLRGAQGTLFGKNTIGGAVNITTRAPGNESDGEVSLTGGNLGRFEASGIADFPVTDQLAISLSGLTRHRDCLFNRVTDNACYGDIDHSVGRMFVRWKPSDTLTVDIIGDYTVGRSHSSPTKQIDLNAAPGTLAATYNSLVSAGVVNGPLLTRSLPIYSNPGRYYEDGKAPTDAPLNSSGVSANIQWQTPIGTFHSITAYRDVNSASNETSDGLPDGNLAEVYDFLKSNWHSQEFRLDGTTLDSRLAYVTGLYYFVEHGVTNELTDLVPQLEAGTINWNYQVTTSEAAFAHLSYNVTPALRFSAGVRFSHEKKDWTGAESSVADGPFNIYTGMATGYSLLAPTNRVASWDVVTPQYGVDYRLTDTTLLFADAARGFRAGGFNGRAGSVAQTAPYDPEYVWTYEIGEKTDLLDHHLRVNATAFYTDYKDLQQTILQFTSNGAFVPVVANAAAARIYGGELEATALVGEGWRFESSFGYTQGEFTEVNSEAQNITTQSKFSWTPKFTVALAAQYSLPIATGSLTPRVDYTWRDTVYFVNNPDSVTTQGPVGLLNARITYADRRNWEVALYGRNLTNKIYKLIGNDVNGGLGFGIITLSDPLEFGLTFTKKF